MKKIGILTFQSSDNFGALLQTFGTFYTLQKLGQNPEVINYVSPNKKEMYRIINISKNPLRTMKNFVRVPLKLNKKIKSDMFRKKYLKIVAPPIETFDELQKIQEYQRKIVVGSDQVWNYENTKFDKRYFLDFVNDPSKKVSYAASFALPAIKTEYQIEYSRLLNDFGYISVREVEAVKIVRDLTSREATHVLDPTLLLNKEEWDDVSKREQVRVKDSNYLLIYAVGNLEHTIRVAKEIAEKKKLQIILIPTSVKDYLAKEVRTLNPSPMEFVQLFNNASYIVTSSFHGLAFATNLNKEFTCCLDVNGKLNSRQLSLLELTKLESRLCYDNEYDNHIHENIEWSMINSNLQAARELSIGFLEQAVNG